MKGIPVEMKAQADSVLQNFNKLHHWGKRGRTVYRNLAFFPITRNVVEGGYTEPVIPLASALAKGQVTVEETGNVETLQFRNNSDSLVFAPVGSYFQGGGQDRALPVSVLLKAYTAGLVPVRCVQLARWEPEKRQAFEVVNHGAMAG